MSDHDDLMASQRAFYDQRADDYGDPSKPSRKVSGLMSTGLEQQLVEGFAPVGDVLELACGTGIFTSELARHARSVTAVDASPRMLEINRERVDSPKVGYVLADIFNWQHERTYDVVFFGFWLSHVPPTMFDRFWALVRSCLAPGGRVAFVDEDDRASHHDDVRPIDGIPAARRTLADGRIFEVVKVFWRPDELESKLRTSGWDIKVRRVGDTFLYGAGAPECPVCVGVCPACASPIGAAAGSHEYVLCSACHLSYSHAEWTHDATHISKRD